MAKRARKPKANEGSELPGGQPTQEWGGSVEGMVGQFAEDLGKLLGATQNKAQAWLSERQAIMKNLTGLRDTVNGLIARMSDGYESGNGIVGQIQPPPLSKFQRRKRAALSPEARERIAAAQRKRWAKLRRQEKTSK